MGEEETDDADAGSRLAWRAKGAESSGAGVGIALVVVADDVQVGESRRKDGHAKNGRSGLTNLQEA